MELLQSNHAAELPKSAEAVVIGGGVIGCACAYFLARDGVDVCLLERGDIGAGTSSAAAVAALLQTKTSTIKMALAKKSLSLLDELHEDFDAGFEYKRSGSLLAASSPTEMELVKKKSAALRTLGLDIQLVNGDEARSLMPMLGPTIIGGSYSPGDAIINPLHLVVAYTAVSRRLHAKIHTFTEVIGIEIDRNRILAVCTNKGKILTETIINAAGVWSPQIAGMVNLDLPITPLKGELLVTEAVPPMMRGTLISAQYLQSKAQLEQRVNGAAPQRSVGITLAQVERGNFIIGSTREQAGFDRQSSYDGINRLVSQLLAIAPNLSHIRILRTYAGLRPITPDGLPIIGRAPQLPGFIVAAGHGGDGISLSAVTAELVVDIFKGTAVSELEAALGQDRFTHKKSLTEQTIHDTM
ncbi:MAG: FAD-binding oxidoreductase [Chloroflexi bacterium]|nr:FAD-binding oxidoreductase [Chloroflexota bacterium]